MLSNILRINALINCHKNVFCLILNLCYKQHGFPVNFWKRNLCVIFMYSAVPEPCMTRLNLLVRPLMTKFICDHQMSNGTWYPKTPHTHEFGPSLKGRRPCLCLITHGYQLVPLYSSLEHSKQTEFTNVLLTRCLDWSMLVLSRTLSCFHHVLTASDYNHPTRFDNTK